MSVKQTKKLYSADRITTSVGSAEYLAKVDQSNKVTLVSLANLKAALLAGLSLNAAADGVFVMSVRASDNSPLMYKPEYWTAQQNAGYVATGVVLVEGGKHLVIAPTESESTLPWSSANVAGGGFTSIDRVTVMGDWAGKSNTEAQITHDEMSGAAYAPGFCSQYSGVGNANGYGIPAGSWWLPSLGEMLAIYANMNKINYALSLITGATLLQRDAYWTSTEYGTNGAWLLSLTDGSMNGYTKSSGKLRVRPVSAFIRASAI